MGTCITGILAYSSLAPVADVARGCGRERESSTVEHMMNSGFFLVSTDPIYDSQIFPFIFPRRWQCRLVFCCRGADLNELWFAVKCKEGLLEQDRPVLKACGVSRRKK